MPTYSADDENLSAELKHYGILRRSGRYPWGSGNNSSTPSRRARTFLEMVDELEAQGLSRSEIARGLGLDSTTKLRQTVTIANNAIRREKQLQAEKLREKGWSTTAIGRHMGLNESSVRELLNPSVQERTQILENTANMLRDEIAKGGYLDVGAGTEYYVPGGLSKEKLRTAIAILKEEGYEVFPVQVDQAMGNNQKTTINTLCPPGTTYKDVVTSIDQIRTLVPHTEDGGRTFGGPLPPLPISPDRVAVSYKEDGGAEHDGVVYVRPGVEDISIGGSTYAQVRIDVGGTHYIKGMAMYKDDLPKGVDLLVQSNKPKGTPKMGDKNNTVLKNQEEDKNNPFGATISRQIIKLDSNGKEHVTSAMNIIHGEGDWERWNRDLSSQVLSKQSPKVASAQLSKLHEKRQAQFDEIMALTNPTVREKLLKSFSESVDSDAVHLNAAGMPRSFYHAILPFNSLKDTEVYAPNFNHGERVALIRYPHGGTFEIPELTVNNRAPEPKKMIGQARDAVGINHKVASKLSGADFDGDFVMVIPNNDTGSGRRIKSSPTLKQLEGFDPQKFKLPDDAPRLKADRKGKLMGDVSNLITDMTIQKASSEEISRAVRHSMVVIDAEKHHLDYKRSAEVHGIAALKERYQGRHPNGQLKGASTLISRATAEARVLDRKPRSAKDGGHIDPATGKLVWTETNAQKVTRRTLKSGEVRTKIEPLTRKSTKLAETEDAYTLLSKDGGTLIERVYADHSNRMKALANRARKEMVNNSDRVPTSPSAKRVYKHEVDQLKADLEVALRNSPRERAAQALHNTLVAQAKAANPHMDDATLKRVRSRSLAEARARMDAKKQLVPISERQWAAIQAGAVSKNMLTKILDNTDIETVKKLATPRPDLLMGSSERARARSLMNQGLTQAEAARVLGVSLTTLKKGLD